MVSGMPNMQMMDIFAQKNNSAGQGHYNPGYCEQLEHHKFCPHPHSMSKCQHQHPRKIQSQSNSTHLLGQIPCPCGSQVKTTGITPSTVPWTSWRKLDIDFVEMINANLHTVHLLMALQAQI